MRIAFRRRQGRVPTSELTRAEAREFVVGRALIAAWPVIRTIARGD